MNINFNVMKIKHHLKKSVNKVFQRANFVALTLRTWQGQFSHSGILFFCFAFFSPPFFLDSVLEYFPYQSWNCGKFWEEIVSHLFIFIQCAIISLQYTSWALQATTLSGDDVRPTPPLDPFTAHMLKRARELGTY